MNDTVVVIALGDLKHETLLQIPLMASSTWVWGTDLICQTRSGQATESFLFANYYSDRLPAVGVKRKKENVHVV